jgi:hypothetical protein
MLIASPLIHLSIFGMARNMCRCLTDASMPPHSHGVTSFSSFNSRGLNSSVSLAGHRAICVASDRWVGYFRSR